MEQKSSKKYKIWAVIATIAAIIILAAFLFVFFKSDFNEKLMVKLGLRQEEYWTDARKAITSWENTVDKLGLDADIVFFGDSLMKNSDFREFFPEVSIVNLGLNGDTITGMMERVSMVAGVNPEKVFVYGGINVLRDSNIDVCVSDYGRLLDALRDVLPDADIYVQSIIPVSEEVGNTYNISPDTIRTYNDGIKNEASMRDMSFVDIYPVYEKDGLINMDYSEDGVHIKDEAYSLWADVIRDEVLEGIQSETITDQISAGDITGFAQEDAEEIVISAWNNMIEKGDITAEIVFFGDSITKNGDFKEYFPDKDIINIGLGGETLSGAIKRTAMIQSLHPEKVFIMSGVNSLRDYNLHECIEDYRQLLDQIISENPESSIYVQSVLPMVSWMQDYLPCSLKTIKAFNRAISDLAEERNLTFINLYKLYEKNGQIDPELSEDGVHPKITHGYDAWAEAIEPFIYE